MSVERAAGSGQADVLSCAVSRVSDVAGDRGWLDSLTQ